jgi:chromosome segregation ATPase
LEGDVPSLQLENESLQENLENCLKELESQRVALENSNDQRRDMEEELEKVKENIQSNLSY